MYIYGVQYDLFIYVYIVERFNRGNQRTYHSPSYCFCGENAKKSVLEILKYALVLTVVAMQCNGSLKHIFSQAN
jgi:hypothetical protein